MQPSGQNRLFNIDVLILTPKHLAVMGEVTKLNVFEPNSQMFDQNGLFSTSIFGPVGTKIRNDKPGYINLHLGILHPLIYLHIISLKTLYEDIFSGKKYATFDTTINDFIEATSETGKTGYSFFIKYLDKIDFKYNDSEQRKYKIDLIKKYGNKQSLIDKWLVLPAGLRDYTVDESNQPSEDEINTQYRKLLATASMIKNTSVTDETISLLDPVRIKLQQISIDIYNHFIRDTMDGKNKFIQGKWAKRAIMYGTRNVITPSPVTVYDLNKTSHVSFNDTVIGTYQFIKAISPITMNKLHTLFINKILSPDSSTANLIDPVTLKTTMVEIPIKKRDEWLSLEGLASITAKLAQDEIKSAPVMIDKYYLLLVYDDGKNIEVIFNTDTMVNTYDPKYIRPITYIELMYLAIYDVRSKYPGLLTRYPVAGLGGIYPTYLYVKTTVIGRTVNVTMNGVTKEVIEYPRLGEEYVNSLSPHFSRLSRLGADFDGDKVSLNVLYTEESIAEITKLLNSKEFYITPTGEITFSVKTDTLELVMLHLSSEDYSL